MLAIHEVGLSEIQRALTTALAAAREAAQVHRENLGRVGADEWSEKGIADFATHVDHEAERRIVDIIARAFPDHDILAEEAAAAQNGFIRKSDYLWIVDPLDGTTNYLHQYPMYSASVALLRENQPVVGAVVCAPTGEEWTASRGGGAFRNGQSVHVSSNTRFERALIGTGFPFKIPELRERYFAQFKAVLSRVSDLRRAGSAALDLCHLATGYFDGFWELDLRPWDFAAGVLMIQEAGGIVTALDGDFDWMRGGGLIAGNPHVYPVLRNIVLHPGELGMAH
jgi:myo-inositol-1(or 4)-monophosphatase